MSRSRYDAAMGMRKVFAFVFAGMISGALHTPAAMASVGLICTALDGSKAEINIALGGGVGFSTLSASATDGKTLFSDGRTPGRKKSGATRFVMAQGMLLNEAYYVDFADDNLEKIIVSLRVNIDLLPGFIYPEPDGDTMFGTLKFEGQKPVPVACDLG